MIEDQTTAASSAPEDTVEAIEERLEKRREARASAEKAQRKIDLLARERLEDDHPVLAAVRATRHVAGQPTQALLRAPKGSEYKRYKQQVQAASGRKDNKAIAEAGELLARSCWVYPVGEADKEAMLDAYPGMLVTMTLAAQDLAEGRTVDEGKD